MFKKTIIALILFLPLVVSAQEDIEFPVSELGNCASHEECKAYCDDESHIEECLDFAVKMGDMTEEKAERIKSMVSGTFEGPGGCSSREECKAYCDNEEHLEECMDFAEENGLMPPERVQRIRERETQTIEGPGGCTSREKCKAYCDNPDHGEECLAFAVEQGRMTQEKADEILEKIEEREMLKEEEKHEFSFEEGPGGCSSEKECKEYCSKFENLEECLSFEVEMGAMTQEEADKILQEETEREKRTVTPDEVNSILQQAGGGPGGCMSQKECDSYCGDKEHAEECISFAKEHGLMPEEKAEQMKKHLEVVKDLKAKGGPGGCTTKEECKAYCDKEENKEECVEFGREHGMITSEKAQQLKDMMSMRKEGGPGGCKSKEECANYCSKEENKEECMNFAKEHGLMNEEKLERIEKIQKIKVRREIEMRKKQEIMGEGQPPEGTKVRTDKDVDLPKKELKEGMNLKNEYQDKIINDVPDKDMMPEGEMPGEEMMEDMVPQKGKEGFGPQSLLDTAKNFLANVGFVGLIEE